MGALIPAIISAVVGVGPSIYSANKQKSASKKAIEAQKKADLEARRIQAESAKPLEATATLGIAEDTNPLTALDLIKIKPASDNTNKTNNTSSNTWGLGM